MFVELCAGLASMSLVLQHGAHCKPPVSRMGNKFGYSRAILRVMGLRPGQGFRRALLCEPDVGCRALLHAYTDPDLMRAAADIIRGWKDEGPRALWERLRAEGPIRDFGARESARWTLRQGWTNGGNPVGQGGRFGGEIIESTTGTHYPLTAAKLTDRLDSLAQASELARYLQVSASNRLINIDSATMQNSGKGGTTHGGDEFATPAGKTADAAREVARWASFTAMSVRATNISVEGGVVRAHTEHWQEIGPRADQSKQQSLSGVAESMRPPATGIPATIVPDAREITPPTLPPGCVVYADFPYLGDGTQKITGYGHDLTLEDQCELVRRWDAAGAAVYVSECVDRRPDFGGNFRWAVDITSTRKGQRRTFSTETGKTEWVTMNREPAWRPAVQQGLFG